MELIPWKEGKVEVLIPDPKKYHISEKMPVFFNPRARISRDLSVLVVKTLRPPQILDAMTGTGIRGVRYAVEAGVDVTFNDINPKAVELARKNAERNGIDGEFVQEDINVLLHTRRFVGIDLDPFGSPSPFLSSLSRSITHKGIALITATDTSPLSGSSPLSAVRKYHTIVRKTSWHRELAVRVLLGYVQHHLMVWEKTLTPIFSYFVENHIRIIGEVVKKPSAVTKAAKKIRIVEGLGPIWTGPLHNREVLKNALKEWDEDYTRESRRILERASEEVETVGYYHTHLLAREVGANPPPMEKLIEELRRLGYKASRSSLEPKGVKTDAPKEVIVDVFRRLS